MKWSLILSFLFLSSCYWPFQKTVEDWVPDTIELLLDMSKRKSMIHDTPLKTMEGLEGPPSGKKLSKQKICRCAVNLYGGMMTVIANDLKEKSLKGLCKGINGCFFKGEASKDFLDLCPELVSKSRLKAYVRDKSKNLKALTKARRQLSSHCKKL